jgi:uncharacterized protein (TIGR02996 family)
MNDHDALLAAVRASPDEDLPRLAFADWYDEHGQAARAEFIRAQVEADRLDEIDSVRIALEDRADALLAEHRAAWLGPAGDHTSRWVFRRGFVESAAVEVDRFADCADAIFRTWPVRHLRFQSDDGSYVRDDDVRHLTRSPWLARLTGLTLFVDADSLSADAAAALARCPYLAELRDLDLNAHEPGAGLGARGVRRLANSRYLHRLTALRLRWQCITDDGARALADSPLLPHLRLLDLGAIHELTDAGLLALLTSPGARSLKSLNIEHSRLSSDVMDALVAWGGHAGPVSLSVGDSQSMEEARLAAAPWLGGLRDLGIGGAGSRVLASPHSSNLTGLRCGGRGVLDGLRRGHRFDRLRTLDTCHSNTGPDLVRALVTVPHVAGLRRLGFWFNNIYDSGLETLVNSPLFAHLTWLNLRFSRVTACGVAALAASAHSSNLRTLLLSGCELGRAGLMALASSSYLTRLRELDLTGVGADDESVAALCRAFPRLRWLDLSSNDLLTDSAIDELTEAGWPLLDHLTLAHMPLNGNAQQRLRARWGPRVELAGQDEWL